MQNQFYVYVLTNYSNAVIYVGVTRDLNRRVYEHKNKLIKGFSSKYNITKLVYYEVFDDVENAILREKQLKSGTRQRKLGLIIKNNPDFNELCCNL